MPLQLQQFIAKNGTTLTIRRKTYTFDGISAEGSGADDIALATFKGPRATYTAVRCNKMTVAGRPGAESWSLMAKNGITVATFAIHEGKLLDLA